MRPDKTRETGRKTRMRLLMITAVALFLLAPTAARSEATYYCYCKGVEQPVLYFFTIHTDCGNSFVGGNKGEWVRGLSFEDLDRYMDAWKANKVREETYFYDPYSGWACGKDPDVPGGDGGGS